MIKLCELLGLQFLDGLFQYLLVSLVAKVGDEARLFATEQVACSANVEILHGQMNARAETREVLDGLKATACILGEQGVGRRKQVAERLLVGSSHSSAQLMQFRQAKVVGIVDDDGVGIRDVETRFDDGGADEHVIFIVGKVEDELFDNLGLHLSVGKGDTRIGHESLDACNDVGQLRDAVVDVEDLSVARELEVDGFLDHRIIVAMHLGLDWIAVGRRRGDDAEVACAHEREL